jgi:hypothetical protein
MIGIFSVLHFNLQLRRTPTVNPPVSKTVAQKIWIQRLKREQHFSLCSKARLLFFVLLLSTIMLNQFGQQRKRTSGRTLD